MPSAKRTWIPLLSGVAAVALSFTAYNWFALPSEVTVKLAQAPSDTNPSSVVLKGFTARRSWQAARASCEDRGLLKMPERATVSADIHGETVSYPVYDLLPQDWAVVWEARQAG
ncbi:hypothetical protein EON81_20970 [bacterium]|nr:MAG: hypothetical protein EON81_20970 [bacterium]